MKLRVLCILSVLALALAGGIAAQTDNQNNQPNTNADQPQTMTTSTATGTVVSSDSGSLVVDTGNGRQTFMVDSSSTVPVNLTPGTRVSIQFHTMPGNRLHAASVTTLSGGAAPAGAQTAPRTTDTTPTTGSTAPTGAAPMGPSETISGTVVSSTPTALVINAPSGRRTFIVDSASTVPTEVARGANVTVEYHILPGNRFHAATVTVEAPTAATERTDTTTTTADQTTTTGERTARNLPATGSELPLVAVIGLASLILAFGVRATMRRSA